MNFIKANIIILFYAFLIMITGYIGYNINKKNGYEYGLIVGLTLSITLWRQFGKKMVKV
jgi:hypothetical protein